MMLEGIRVLDFTRLLPGPYATLRLADLGAHVIKVENGVNGDPARYMGQLYQGTGVVFLAQNRGKESFHVDLNSTEGRNVVLHLVKQADVLIESYRPGVMEAFGLGYETLKEVNPTLVYCSLTGYGQSGPRANYAGHDLNFLAYSGVLSQFTDSFGVPVIPTHQFGDLVGGMAASEAILAALVARGRTGEGTYLDIAMVDVLIGLMTTHGLTYSLFGTERGIAELSGSRICYAIYPTSDGRYVALAALEEKFWWTFCQNVGHPEWRDAQYSEAVNDNPVYRSLTILFKTKTLAEWAEWAQERDCCLTPIYNISETLRTPYVLERRLTFQMTRSKWGPLLQVKTSAGGYREANEEAMSPPPELSDSNFRG